MNEQDLRTAWFNNPEFKINISTKLRRDMMLGNDLTITIAGKMRYIKFRSVGGGIWEAYTDTKKDIDGKVQELKDTLACLLHIYQDAKFGDNVWRLLIEERAAKLCK